MVVRPSARSGVPRPWCGFHSGHSPAWTLVAKKTSVTAPVTMGEISSLGVVRLLFEHAVGREYGIGREVPAVSVRLAHGKTTKRHGNGTKEQEDDPGPDKDATIPPVPHGRILFDRSMRFRCNPA